MSTLDRPRTTIAAAPPSAMVPLSDSALATMIAHGRDGAFEVLYERYRADLSRYCRALLRNPEDAEEAFQGTMLNALRALRSGEGGRNMRPWLYRIAHNQCASMIRARRPSSVLNPEQPSPADPPEEQVALSEQIRHLRADLGSLPALQRSALVMREMSGLSHRAIAQALSVEPADARQLVYEARRSLDECRIGREAGCAELRTQIADGDRRRLRSRRVRAHLRNCDDCTAYVASQEERRRGYAALAPAMPAAAGKQVFDRLMGSSGSGAAAGGSAVIGVPGGVAGTIAGLAAGLSPATSARAWARLPDSTATGLAGAGATAGVALLSLALTALLLSGDNAAHGSAVDPPPSSGTGQSIEVAVVAPPGADSIGYRAQAPVAGPDAVTSSGPADADPVGDPATPAPAPLISISIEGEVIAERPPPPARTAEPPASLDDGFEVADLPEPPLERPGAAPSRPRLVDPPAAPAKPAAAVAPPPPAAVPPPAPAPGEAADGAGSGPDPEPAAREPQPASSGGIAPSEDAGGATIRPVSLPEKAAPDAESVAGLDPVVDPEVGSLPDPEPVVEEPDPEVGSLPDPEPVVEREGGVEASGSGDDDLEPGDLTDDGTTGGGAETVDRLGGVDEEVGSLPDPEPRGERSRDRERDFAECPGDSRR